MTGTIISSWRIARLVRTACLYSVGIVVLLHTPMSHASDKCSGIDSEKIEQHVAQELGLPQKTLFAKPRTDLDDRLVDLQYVLRDSSDGQGVPGAQIPIVGIIIFDLSRQGYRVIDGKLAGMVVDLDAAPRWRVAYSCATGSIYHLYGFEDSDHGFNMLISTLGIKVDSTDSALDVLDSFVALTYRSGIEELIKNRLDLLKSALAQYGGKDDVDSFLAAWRKTSAAVGQKVTSPTATASGDQFRLKCYVGTEEGIESVMLSMGTDGRVNTQSKIAVYRWTIQKR